MVRDAWGEKQSILDLVFYHILLWFQFEFHFAESGDEHDRVSSSVESNALTDSSASA